MVCVVHTASVYFDVVVISSKYIAETPYGDRRANSMASRHEKLIHDKPHKCGVVGCVQACSTKKDLERHQRAAHTDPLLKERAVCDVPGCGRDFARPDHVARHKRDAHRSAEGPGWCIL